MMLESGNQVGDEARVAQLASGDVEGHSRGRQLFPQFNRHIHHPVEDVAAQRHDEAGFLGEGNERIGSHQSHGWVLPPDQGFDAGPGPGPEVHGRLVVHDELVAFDGTTKISLQRETPRHVVTQASVNVQCADPAMAFATYMAASASRISPSASVERVLNAIPIEIEKKNSPPCREKGAAIADSMSWARSSTVSVSASATRSANSSPPKRATMVPLSTTDLKRSAMACRIRSPSAWPSPSLIHLNPSRSRKSTAGRCSRVSSLSERSLRNLDRLTNPVSESNLAAASRRAMCWSRCNAKAARLTAAATARCSNTSGRCGTVR